jgi:hypothetical protein
MKRHGLELVNSWRTRRKSIASDGNLSRRLEVQAVDNMRNSLEARYQSTFLGTFGAEVD